MEDTKKTESNAADNIVPVTGPSGDKKPRLFVIISAFFITAGIIFASVSIFKLTGEIRSLKKGQAYYSSFSNEHTNGRIDAFSYDGLGIAEEKTAEEPENVFTGIVPNEVDEETENGSRALKRTGNRVVSWLRLEGTIIDYPVMQCGNNDYYLSHLPDGTEHKMGSIYLDYENSPDFTDKNSVIYGHHMKSGDMFTTLKYYNDQSFYDKHPVVLLSTFDADYEILLFGGYIVDAASEYIPFYFADDSEFLSYISEVRKRSVFRSDVEINENDRIVSLCTCSYEYENARMLVIGKLTEINAAE